MWKKLIQITGAVSILLTVSALMVRPRHPGPRTHFHVVVPSYNNEQWCIANLESILSQRYPYPFWHVTIITDACTDMTYELISQYLHSHESALSIDVKKNSSNQGAVSNIYHAVCDTPDDEVIVLLDGDDWFAHPEVLTDLDSIYQHHDVWLTYGQYQRWPQGIVGICREIDPHVIAHNQFRQAPYVLSHTKTFYAWLCKLIDPADLMYEGKFYDVCYDMVFMLPMIEMAGERHRFLEKVSYIYNTQNMLCDYRVRGKRQWAIADHIRGLPPYQRLAQRPDSL